MRHGGRVRLGRRTRFSSREPSAARAALAPRVVAQSCVRRVFHGRGCCLRGACRVAAAPPRGQSGSSAIMLCGCVFSLLRERAFLFEARAERAGSSARNAGAGATRAAPLAASVHAGAFFLAADAARIGLLTLRLSMRNGCGKQAALCDSGLSALRGGGRVIAVYSLCGVHI